MWEPRRLTTLWASTACYSYSFTFILLAELNKRLLNIGTVTMLRAGRMEFHSRQVQKFFCQPLCLMGVNLTIHLHLEPRLRMSWVVLPSTTYVFMPLCYLTTYLQTIIKRSTGQNHNFVIQFLCSFPNFAFFNYVMNIPNVGLSSKQLCSVLQEK
jgi:hypothetical protein